jgi:5-formyltetrahydrofolate cyclo-ligase
VNTNSEKERQRKVAQSRRRALPAQLRQQYERAICARLADLPALQSAKLVMSYMAFAGEVDLSPVHELLLRQGVALCFPRCGDEHTMEALLPQCEDAWSVGSYGIRTPVPEYSVRIPPERLDAVLIPCVAFDETARRLGWGGGFYDRFLPRCTNAARIGVAFECQRVDRIASQTSLDVVPDVVVTERKLYKKQ